MLVTVISYGFYLDRTPLEFYQNPHLEHDTRTEPEHLLKSL
jgi:hypothetical protein